MKKVINVIFYMIMMIAIVATVKFNPYLNDIYDKKNITSDKSFNKYFESSKYVCIDLKDSKMTRFKEEKRGIVYISSYSNKNFISILTKGTVLNDKVCGEIKEEDNLSKELKESIKSEDNIKLTNKYFTNYNYDKSLSIYKYILSTLIVLFFIDFILLLVNFILILRKKY
jgi:hypothetical protein